MVCSCRVQGLHIGVISDVTPCQLERAALHPTRQPHLLPIVPIPKHHVHRLPCNDAVTLVAEIEAM
jgi:hypothetical protein